MEEQDKIQGEKNDQDKSVVKTLTKLVIAGVAVIVGVMLSLVWWTHLAGVIKACVGPFLILVGVLIFLMSR